MTVFSYRFMSAGVLAGSLILPLPLVVVANAADSAKTIGTTVTGAPIPTTEEALAARLMPSDPNPAPGENTNPVAATVGAGTPATAGIQPVSPFEGVRAGPIGATGQTMPAKFSERNAVLDRVPIMAMPLALTQEQRRHIYQTVMADKSTRVAAGSESLAPSSGLSAEQALNEVKSFPEGLENIEMLKGLGYMKADDRVLIVRPATRIVVDAITL